MKSVIACLILISTCLISIEAKFLHYVRDRYGSNHSLRLLPFQPLEAKQAIRDVFKRFGAKEFELSQLSKRFLFVTT